MTPGQLVLLVENRSPVSITDIRLTPVLVDAAGQSCKPARNNELRRLCNPANAS